MATFLAAINFNVRKYLKPHRIVAFHQRPLSKQSRHRKALHPYTVKEKRPCVTLFRHMTVNELAQLLQKTEDDLKLCFGYLGVENRFRNMNDAIDDIDVLIAVTKLSGFRYRFGIRNTPEVSPIAADSGKDLVKRPPPEPHLLVRRPPIVTVMGHVDHGKTTLLDAIRKSHVADEEYGGITQQIGAFLVTLPNGGKITFIDTPGHAAFVAMRERGVRVTDIVVLVVAADDGFMPQTAECLYHIRKENVPFIVAINKVDKDNANVPRTLQTLLLNGIQVDEMGGDILSAQISALKNKNVDRLLETILMLAEEIDVRGDPTGFAEGLVLESKQDSINGPVATVIIQRGQLKVGHSLVAGMSRAKVRKIISDSGVERTSAGLSDPVMIMGWKSLPHAGSDFIALNDDRRAKQVVLYREQLRKEEKMKEATERIEKQRQIEREGYKSLLEYKRKSGQVFRKDRSGPNQIVLTRDTPSVAIILKADTDGAVETLLGVIDSYESNNLVFLDVVHFGVGDITLTDIEHALLYQGIIYGFNVNVSPSIQVDEFNCPIRLHRVIYHLIDDLKNEIQIRVPPVDVEKIIGKALVKQVFSVQDKRRKSISIAGCTCEEGELTNSDLYKVIRDGTVIYTGMVSSLKHLKENVNIVSKGTDCGLTLRNCDVPFQPGDQLVCFRVVPEIPKAKWNQNF